MDRTIAIGYQERLFKLILAFKENKYCADCQSLNPDWASTTLGVFVCYKCSGNHRSFGLHITRIKSTTLDTWTLKQVYVMGFVDNKISNAYWEANIPKDFVKPTYDSAPNDLISFARKKYVEKAFIVQGQESPAEEIRSNLILTAGESEDKEEFFNSKLEELKKLLKEKVLASSPDKAAPKNRTPKKAGTIVIRPERVSDLAFRRFGSPQKDSLQALVSPLVPFGQKINRDPFHFETGSPGLMPPGDLPLFQGLNIKTITTIDEELDENMPRSRFQRPFLKANTQEYNTLLRSPEPKSGLITSTTSKNNLMTVPSKRKIIDYLEEEEIFEESKGPTPRCSIEEIELHDLSSISSTQENKNHLLPRTDAEQLLKPFPIKSKTSDAGGYDAHIKRPSEEFSVPKCLSMQELPPTRLGRVDRLWKYPVLLVCFLLHFAMGYMYCWGSISPYIASFVMNDYQDDRYTEHTNHNMMIFIGIAMGFCLCENIAQSIGMRTLVFVSFLGLGGSILVCSLTQDVLLYSGLLTIVAGFFIGLLYEIPFYCASQYFYAHPVFLKTFFYLANSVGAFGYIYFGYYCLKQGDTDKELEVQPTTTYSFYSTSLVASVPELLSKIGIGIIIMGIVGAILLQPRSSFIIKDYSGYRDHEESLLNVSKRSSTRSRGGRMRRKAPAIIHQGLKEALISPSTKTLLSIIILYSILGSYMLCSYKYLGLLHHYSDAIMSLVGGTGMIMLGVGKMVGVVIHPKYEFKLMCKKIITCQIIAGMALFLLGQAVDLAFLVLFVVIMFLDGLMFSIIVEETKFVHLEDIEDTMVALMILGYGVANFLSFMIVKPLIMLELRSAIILVLTMPIFYAYKKCREYSRATSGDDSEMIADLLDVSQQSLELRLL